VDVHSDVAAACIKNLDIISNNFFVQEAIEDIFRKPISDLQDEIVFVAPDAGAAKKVYKLAKEIGFKGDIVVCSKYRDEEGELSNLSINLDILSNLHKMFIIIDDICDGGRTFINISEYLKKEYGIGLFNKVLFVTHGIFSQGFDQLLQEFSTIATTNSYQDFPEMEESPKFTLINVI
jgi:ribose-phosphate pyrophosphokinase